MCKPRYSGISVLQPTSVVGPSTVAEARLELASDRTRNDPPTLSWEVSVDGTGEKLTGAPLQLVADGLYRGEIAVDRTGTFRLVVSYPEAGLSSAEVPLSRDPTAPALSASLPAPSRAADSATLIFRDPVAGFGADAWRRDETFTVTIASDAEDLDPARVQVRLVGIGAGGLGGREDPLPVTPASGCGQRYCATAPVDLALAEMGAFRGEMRLLVTARDLAGNLATDEKVLKVTRWKWAYAAGGKVKVTPAIGSTGKLYFGTDAATANVIALNPGGAEVWKKNYGAMEGSPAVGAPVGGRERVYVGVTGSTGAMLYALHDATGDVLSLGTPTPAPASCGPYSGGVVLGAAAVSDTTAATTIETMHAVYNLGTAGGGSLVALRPGGSTGALCVLQTAVENVPAGGGVVVSGTDAYFSDLAGKIRAYTFNAGSWDPRFAVSTGFFTYALAVLPGAGQLLAGGGGPGSGAVLTLPLAGGAVSSLTGTAAAWNPAVGGTAASPFAFLGMNDGTLRQVPADLSSEISVATSGVVRGAPAVGRDGLLYVTTATGALEVRSSSDLSLVWSAAEFGPLASDTLGDASASVALDCARPDDGGAALPGRPGTLYAGSASTNKLYAFVVDARGLDPEAPWPKYQHDERNSGNPAAPITVCP